MLLVIIAARARIVTDALGDDAVRNSIDAVFLGIIKLAFYLSFIGRAAACALFLRLSAGKKMSEGEESKYFKIHVSRIFCRASFL